MSAIGKHAQDPAFSIIQRLATIQAERGLTTGLCVAVTLREDDAGAARRPPSVTNHIGGPPHGDDGILSLIARQRRGGLIWVRKQELLAAEAHDAHEFICRLDAVLQLRRVPHRAVIGLIRKNSS